MFWVIPSIPGASVYSDENLVDFELFHLPHPMPSKIKAPKPEKKAKASASTLKAAAPTLSSKPAAKSKSPKAKIIQRTEDSDSGEEDAGLPDASVDEGESSLADAEIEEDDDGSESGDEDDDEADVEEGMARLMKLLGEDGLDDVGRSELEALVADEEISDEDDDGEEEEEGEGASAGEDAEEGEVEESSPKNVAKSAVDAQDEDEDDELEEEADILLEDADSIDEDAVPRQKIEIDNKVPGSYSLCLEHLLISLTDCAGEDTRYHQAESLNTLDGDVNSHVS